MARTRRSPVKALRNAVTLTSLFAVCCSPAINMRSSQDSVVTDLQETSDQSTASQPCNPATEPLPPAGEGMWPWHDLSNLDESALKKRGLNVNLSELWTPGKGGILRAVAGLPGCTASFVSDDGLLLTNHHCIHRAIQRNSTPDHDYLNNGFVARTRADELQAFGTTVYVFQQQSDVTSRVLDNLDQSLSDYERMREIGQRESAIVRECEQKPNTSCSVARENNGLRFMLLENLDIHDVRLVAFPPESLGNFGGEIDNWHWPRHSLDFALIRAYVAPNNSPAEFSTNNKPYKPERYLKVSPEFPKPPDFVMVPGKPGRTRRYATAVEVEDALNWFYPARESILSDWITTLETAAGDPAAKLTVSSQVRSLNNGLFNARGMMQGLRVNRAVERAKNRDNALRNWIGKDPARTQRFGSAIDDLENHLQSARNGRDRDMYMDMFISGSQVFGFARRI
ncbi:MAG: S46 family peptidase, partial [Polyangiaceae bacterium]|nr:S46 family peptidase [Polyangiaceae bacterium]